MKPNPQDSQPISQQAAQWLCELLEGGAQEQAAFLTWIKQSPRHVEEFLFASATWKKLRQMGASQPMDIDAILAELRAGQAGGNIITLKGDVGAEEKSLEASSLARISSAPAKSVLNLRWVAGLAAFTLTLLLSWWAFSAFSNTYTTAIGEQRTVRLSDGSVLYLNTGSRARVRFSGEARDIALLEGEAFFVVAQERGRPFRVLADTAVIQAVGTAFNVRRRTSQTQVTVVEGRVKVTHEPLLREAPLTITPSASPSSALSAAQLLSAGEEAMVARGAPIVKRKPADIVQAVAWRERRLVFRAERLENVIAEVNRYSTRPFRIEGEAARNTELTATFAADHPESLASFLEKYSDLAVERRAEGFVIREGGKEQESAFR